MTYHLQRLVGQFVERTDDGYALRPEGRTLHRAIRAGTFTRRVSVDPFDAGFDCYFCAAPVEGRYGEGAFELRCSGCGHVYAHTRAPPSAVAGGGDDTASSPEAILDRIDRFTRHEVLAYAQRVCPICVGDLDVEFVPGETVWTDGSERLDVFVRYACDHCSNVQMTSVGLSLLHHPALVAFLHDHGVDVAATPHWEFEFAVTDRHVTVRSTDPWEVALSVTRDDETLELVVDGDLAVTRTTRS